MSWFEKWSVWSTTTVVSVTGVVYFWMKYFMQPIEPWAVINHPWQPWVLKLHIVSAPLLVFALGLITLRHIWEHFRSRVRWGRKSGIITAAVAGPMILTGYLIQSITHEGWLTVMAISHITLGLLFGVGLALHRVFVRRRSVLDNGWAQSGQPRQRREPPVRRVARVGP